MERRVDDTVPLQGSAQTSPTDMSGQRAARSTACSLDGGPWPAGGGCPAELPGLAVSGPEGQAAGDAADRGRHTADGCCPRVLPVSGQQARLGLFGYPKCHRSYFESQRCVRVSFVHEETNRRDVLRVGWAWFAHTPFHSGASGAGKGHGTASCQSNPSGPPSALTDSDCHFPGGDKGRSSAKGAPRVTVNLP